MIFLSQIYKYVYIASSYQFKVKLLHTKDENRKLNKILLWRTISNIFACHLCVEKLFKGCKTIRIQGVYFRIGMWIVELVRHKHYVFPKKNRKNLEFLVLSRFVAEELKSWNLLTRTGQNFEFINWRKLTIICFKTEILQQWWYLSFL